MNATELSELFERRFDMLSQLLELSEKQIKAIDENRMSDLMRILSDKQQPITQLVQIGQSLANAVGEDPTARVWSSPEERQRCRNQQQQCESMHDQLLAIEADCEVKLVANRASAQEKLQRHDSVRVAATSYAQSQNAPPSGGSLDLSSN
ncbi:FlgN protein [Rubripirellula tenax]|uniref:FlgN protein n=1 Tax=Rubripirellula tenax TaxID=2528015 RepID=A0A5C6EMB4_9BACT|nr:flagellar export chaperone FlgN [Rubripirellula tenax]TWU50893.1 FlgN protein [Rubripirellula tenax]